MKSRLKITLSSNVGAGHVYSLAEEACVFFHDLCDDAYDVFFEFNGTDTQLQRGDTPDRLVTRWSIDRQAYQASHR